jgi:hypothetical protein
MGAWAILRLELPMPSRSVFPVGPGIASNPAASTAAWGLRPVAPLGETFR